MMTVDQVKSLVAEVLELPVYEWRKGKGNDAITNARYIAYLIMIEEGIKPSEALAAIDLSRFMKGRVNDEVNGRLKVRKDFKEAYLKCIARIAEQEIAE